MSQEETCTNLGNGSMTGNEAPNKLAGVIGGFGAERGSSTSQSIEDMATLLINTHASLWHFWISDNLSPKRYVYIISDEMIPGLTTCLQIVSDNFDPQKKKKKICSSALCHEWACWKHQLGTKRTTQFYLFWVRLIDSEQVRHVGVEEEEHRTDWRRYRQPSSASSSCSSLTSEQLFEGRKKICVHTEDS